MVERVVVNIDEIVRLVRFPGWQATQAGEREVKKAPRKALFKYKLHADDELFEKPLRYVKQYYQAALGWPTGSAVTTKLVDFSA